MTRAAGAALALLAALSFTSAFAKPGTPGPHYFAGTFERVGRAGGSDPVLLNDRVTITPQGQSVVIRDCSGPEMLMGFGPAFELENLMTGSMGDTGVECLFHNNGYNRPLLTCRASDGAVFTLWPLAGAEPDAPLDCPG
jgi:hypothetical protein